MNPPGQAAVQEAVSTLLRSVSDENTVSQRDFLRDYQDVSSIKDLETLRTLSSALDCGVAALAVLVKQQRAVVRRQMNSLVTINQLPVELLGEIMDWNIHISKDWSVSHLYTLASVSSHRHKIVHDTPRLWAYISAKSLHEVSFKLRKSGAAPLTVKYILGSNLKMHYSLALYVSISRHAARIESLTCNHRGFGELVPMRNPWGPWLRKIGLIGNARAYEDNGDPEDWIVVQQTTPHVLREVRIRYVALSWSTARLEGLRVLCISHVRIKIPGVAQLRSILNACPRLEELSLEYLEPPLPFSETLDTNYETVDLPYLVRLDLSHIPESMALDLLRAIRPGNLEEFTVDCKLTLASLAEMLQLIFKKEDNFPPLFTKAIKGTRSDASTLYLSRSALIIVGGAPGTAGYGTALAPTADRFSLYLRLDVQCQTDELYKATPTWSSHIHINRLPVSLITTAIGHSAESPPHPALLRQLSTLHHLDVILQDTPAFNDLLSTISEAQQASDGQEEWICPELDTLKFRCWSPRQLSLKVMRRIQRLSEKRKEASNSGLCQKVIVELPAATLFGAIPSYPLLAKDTMPDFVNLS